MSTKIAVQLLYFRKLVSTSEKMGFFHFSYELIIFNAQHIHKNYNSHLTSTKISDKKHLIATITDAHLSPDYAARHT